MPLFFFISGFIAYKSSDFWTQSFFKQRIITKAKVQLIPAVVFSIFFSLCYGLEPFRFLWNGFGFFWFTPVLFEMFCIYFPCCYLLRKRPKTLDLVLIAIAFSAFPSYKIFAHFVNTGSIGNLLCMNNMLYYFHFFVLGHLVHKHKQRAFAIVSNDWCNLAAIIIFVASMIIYFHIKIEHGIAHYGLSLFKMYIPRHAGLFIVFSFFVHHHEYFASGGRLSRTMQYVGRHTLDIYMLHNFFLPMNIGVVHTIVKTASNNVITQMVVEFSAAAVIVSVCLLISKIIRNSNTLAHYLFGAKREKATIIH